MRSLEQLDSWISSKVRSWSGKIAGNPRTAELLEIRRDILNNIRDQIHPKGDGKNIFPFNSVAVQLAAGSPARQALFEGAFIDTAEWQETISSLLAEASCPVPAGLHVSVSVVNDPDLASASRPFHIQYGKDRTDPRKLPSVRPRINISVLRGQADLAEYLIDSERINLGRLAEVLSDKDGLRRRNHIAFAESETTVSREHAFIRYDDQSGRFRLFDSMSSRGTQVFRDGHRMDVPKGPTRGFQLRSGDEIHLGEARLRFNIEPTADL